MNPIENQKRGKWGLLLLIGILCLATLLVRLTSAGDRQNVLAAPLGAQSADGLWQDVDETLLRTTGERVIVPTAYRTVSLDWQALNSLLADVPNGAAEAATSDLILTLPLPDGTDGRFQIYKTAVLHPDLAAKFPELQTYAGTSLDDPTAYARLDTTPQGFHAMILSGDQTVFIDPYSRGNTSLYISYFKSDFVTTKTPILEPNITALSEVEQAETVLAPAISGSQRRTYRLAVAATVEYTAYHSADPGNPTVAEGLGAVMTTINRVTGIYERDVAVAFQLIANNDLIIYTAEPDGYTNGDSGAMVSENQTNLDAVIGDANYDIGHAFGTGLNEGFAPGNTCVPGTKAQGMTGTEDPVGDPFDVDFVSHEMGHQMGANHTFNSSICASARWFATAFEPGSGTTIMAYAGLCPTQNIQLNSDDYFHGVSIEEMVDYTTVGSGSSCGTVESTGNTPPVVEAGDSYSIPLNTPFILTGSA
ncbi:MAG: hypothetical protein KC449_18355, partial [Anaerolineales bacterium]|nr:hypothetical protein [Anaerolineales bacterium]